MDGLISFNTFVTSTKEIGKELIPGFWKFCCCDVKSKTTGDIYWHGLELDKNNDKNSAIGYVEDWEGLLWHFITGTEPL